MMIYASESDKWYFKTVGPIRRINPNSVPEIAVISSGSCIRPENISTLLIITLSCIKETRILGLHSFQIVEQILHPWPEGSLPVVAVIHLSVSISQISCN